jgi:hypothetical protein
MTRKTLENNMRELQILQKHMDIKDLASAVSSWTYCLHHHLHPHVWQEEWYGQDRWKRSHGD